MFRVLTLIVASIFSLIARGEVLGFDMRCFTHRGVEPVNLRFASAYLPEARLSVGYVQYEKFNDSILLSFVGSEETVLDDDRPVEVTTTWREVFKTKFGGEYKVISQGANIYGFSYKSRNGRVTNFEYNSSAIMPNYRGCSWG